MSLKFKLDSLEGLDDATKALYEQKGDKFVLKVDGLEDGDVAGLKKKVEDLLAESAEQKKKLKEKDDSEKQQREAARIAADEAAAKKGDLEALRKSADERVAAAIAETEGKYKPLVEKQGGSIRKLLVDNVAQQLAAKIGLKGSEALLMPHIQSRLDVEERNGEYVTVVKGGDGKASALTIADLEKEFVSNAAFAPVIAGSQGSGGGAGGNQKPGGGATGAKTIKRSEFNALDAMAKQATMKEGTTVID